jgi:hypothetical protein
VGDDSQFVFHQKLLGKEGSVKQGVVMVKQPGLFLPKYGVTSSRFHDVAAKSRGRALN